MLLCRKTSPPALFIDPTAYDDRAVEWRSSLSRDGHSAAADGWRWIA